VSPADRRTADTEANCIIYNQDYI